MAWIVIAEWPDGTHSFLRVDGTDDGPDMNALFWELDIEANPFGAKMWHCKSHRDVHIGQEKDLEGNLVFVSHDEKERPLLPLEFPVGFAPYDQLRD